jgi:hypothetical protein
VQWITLFRKVENGFLYIKDAFDAMEVATNVPFYKYMRSTRHRRKIITKFILLHQSWAWEEDEIYTKITNWSHKDDSDNFAYFNFRKGINLDNYKTIKNFHEKDPTKWKSLEYVAEKDIYNLSINMSDASLRKMRYKKHLIHILREYFPKSVQQKIGTIFKKLTK